MLRPQVTLSGDAEWPKVADTVIEADSGTTKICDFTRQAAVILTV